MSLIVERTQAFERLKAQHATVMEIRGRLHSAEDAKKPEIEQEFDRAYAEWERHKIEVDRVDALIRAEDQIADEKHRVNPIQRRGPAETNERKEQHRRAFNAYLRAPAHETNALALAKEHLKSYGPEEINALLGTVDDLGGFTIPEDFRAELLRALPGYATFRAAGARVVTTNRQLVIFPTVRSGTDPYSSDLTSGNAQAVGGNANWKAEGHTVGGAAPPQQDRPTFGQERIPVHVWQPNAVELTRELLDDSAFPLETLLAQLFAEVKGLDEDWAFIIGDGNQKPEGLLNAGIATVNVGNPVTYGGLVDLFYTLRAQYRSRSSWLVSSLVFGEILKLQTGVNGLLIFPPNAPPGTIFNRPVFFTEFMANPGAGNNILALGDFSQYVIAERSDMRIQRLVERFAPNIGVLPHARLGGQLTRRESFRIGVQS